MTTRRELREARRSGGRLRALAVSTLVLGALVLAGVSTAGGTFALLTARTEVPTASITAGTFELRVNDVAAASLGAWNLTPAAPQAKAFTVTSVGDVSSLLSMRMAVPANTALAPYTQARITPVASAAACTVGLGGPLAAVSGYTLTTFDALPAGTTRTYCLELALQTGTPVAQSGSGLSFTLTVDAAQEAH